jgi:ribonuclease Z
VRPGLQPGLVNPPFGDPALFVDFLFERRAFLFDLGDLHALAPRKILRVSDIFVSHCHMDHFLGFDWLLRICLGRDRGVRLFGPTGFLDQVAAKLAAYTWNLVDRYANDFVLTVHEVAADGQGRRARFRVGSAFRREAEAAVVFDDLVLLDEPGLRVRAVVLDHGTPCLAFALEEKRHVNIWKNRLAERGFDVGPWLQGLKRAVLADRPPETPIPGPDGRAQRLGDLLDCLEITPGLKIVYVTDAAYSAANVERIVALARDADWLCIESVFLDADAGRAADKKHLTAGQAGRLARQAGVRSVVPFHFSPVYKDREDALRSELERAWRG